MSFPWWHPPGGLAWLPQQFLFDANTRQGVWTPRAGRSAMLFACFCSNPQLKMDWVHLTRSRLEGWSSFRTCAFPCEKHTLAASGCRFIIRITGRRRHFWGAECEYHAPEEVARLDWRVWWFWVGKTCDFHGILTWFNQQSFGIEPFHGDIMRKVHCIWHNLLYQIWGNEHPFASYVGVRQGAKIKLTLYQCLVIVTIWLSWKLYLFSNVRSFQYYFEWGTCCDLGSSIFRFFRFQTDRNEQCIKHLLIDDYLGLIASGWCMLIKYNPI